MKTDASFTTKTIRELQVIARQANVAGWHDLRKSDLISALEKALAAENNASKSKTHTIPEKGGKKSPSSRPSRKKKEPLGTKVESTSAAVKKSSVTNRKTESSRTPEKKSQSSVPKKKAAVARKSAPEPVAKKKVPVKGKGDSSSKSPGTPRKSVGTPAKKSTTPTKAAAASESAVPVRKKAITSKSVDPKSSRVKSVSVVPSGKKSESKPSKPDKSDKSTPYSASKKAAKAPISPQAEPGVSTVPVTEVQKKISVLKEKLLLHKTLGTDTSSANREPRNQLILMVRDPFWLHAYWEISSQLIDRIRAAMAHLWHTADPVLRLYKMNSDSVGTLRKEYLSDIRIHGGINNWYIDVDDPPSSFLVEIGYLARDGQFFILLSSNIVETPQRYVHDSFGHPDVSWTGIPTDFQSGRYVENGTSDFHGSANKFEGAPRPFTPSNLARTTSSPLAWSDPKKSFGIEVDAELVIKGQVTPHVQVAIKGENIRLKEDGTFSIRYHLPERRHVFPVVAVSPDGVETRTIILAVERNTKILETVMRDDDDE